MHVRTRATGGPGKTETSCSADADVSPIRVSNHYEHEFSVSVCQFVYSSLSLSPVFVFTPSPSNSTNPEQPEHRAKTTVDQTSNLGSGRQSRIPVMALFTYWREVEMLCLVAEIYGGAPHAQVRARAFTSVRLHARVSVRGLH